MEMTKLLCPHHEGAGSRVSISREEISAGSLAETINELQATEPFKTLHEMMKR